MDPQTQRIALAIAFGWRVRSFCKSNYLVPPSVGFGDQFENIALGWENGITGREIHFLYPTFSNYIHLMPPDFLRDLNAIHYGVKTLSFTQRQRYYKELQKVCSEPMQHEGDLIDISECIEATAPQKCEAILKALNLWEK